VLLGVEIRFGGGIIMSKAQRGQGELLMKWTMTTIITLGFVLLAAGLVEGAAASEETEEFIREIVKSARSDSERSNLLMEAVALVEDNDTLKIALLERAVQYGIKGLRTTEDCSKFQDVLVNLLKVDPDRRPHWLSQQAVLFRRWGMLTKSVVEKKRLAQVNVEALTDAGSAYAAKGDWRNAATMFNEGKLRATANRLPAATRLSKYLLTATYLYKTQDKIAGHAETIKKTPDDFKTRSELVNMLVTVIDDPQQAAKYLNEDVDERLRTYVPLAAKGLSELPAESCKNLGDWYMKDLAQTTNSLVKSRMLRRAQACYDKVLELDGEANITSAALKLSLVRIKSDLAKLGGVDPLLCMYCSGTRRMDCPACITDGKATGLRRCYSCKGTGRGKCRTCSGLWQSKCPKCRGRGKVQNGTRKMGGAYYKVYVKCSTCAGKGVTHRSTSTYSARPGACPTCSRLRPESRRGTGVCTYCSGKGGSGTCYSCRGKKTAYCTRCRSIRIISPFKTIVPDRPKPKLPTRTRSSTDSPYRKYKSGSETRSRTHKKPVQTE